MFNHDYTLLLQNVCKDIDHKHTVYNPIFSSVKRAAFS